MNLLFLPKPPQIKEGQVTLVHNKPFDVYLLEAIATEVHT